MGRGLKKGHTDSHCVDFTTDIDESHYSHMCSSTLNDPILPHVHFLREYALACLATCAVPPNMLILLLW